MEFVMLCFFTILAGTSLTVQAGINAQLQNHWANNPILASCVSFAVGTLALVALVAALRIPIPALPAKITLWHWTGGFLGAFVVTTLVYAAPRLGATTTVTLVLAGQVGVSLALDHFGLLGYAERAVTWQRLFGAAMVAAGVFVIRKF